MLFDNPTANARMGAVQYSLIFVNNSAQAGSACVYQQDPNLTVPDVQSLAWFSQVAAPTTKIVFSWSITYDFVWAETGELVPGVVFLASQSWPADLSTTNQISLTNTAGAYTFRNQGAGPSQGNLYINEDGTLPPNQAAVGVGMSGFGTFVVQVQPNMNLIFSPHPQYWITFGNYFQGEVMDITEITNSAEIQFPPNVYSMTATLSAENLWTVVPTASANAQFLKGRRRHPELKWGQDPQDLPSKQQGRLPEPSHQK